mgnify:CR=1 FL=1
MEEIATELAEFGVNIRVREKNSRLALSANSQPKPKTKRNKDILSDEKSLLINSHEMKF